MTIWVTSDTHFSHANMPGTVNVHGHIHSNGDLGERYINVSVEATDFTPLSLEEIKQRVKDGKWVVCPPFPRS